MNWNILSPRTNFPIVGSSDMSGRRVGSLCTGPSTISDLIPRNSCGITAVSKSLPWIEEDGSGYDSHESGAHGFDGTESIKLSDTVKNETTSIHQILEDNKKKLLSHKVSSAFVFAAFRHQRRFSEDLKIAKRKKEEEAAARMILHNLLLNSWRNCKSELDSLELDNAQLNKSVENLQLQLRVMRHMQTAERDKMLEKVHEMERIKSNITILEEEKRKNRIEIDKMEGELNDIQASIEKLKEENATFKENVKKLTEENTNLGKSLEAEKHKSTKYENMYESLKEESDAFESRIKEISSQSDQWKERARAFESEVWEQRLKMEGKEAEIRDIQLACDQLRQEKLKVLKSKASLKEQMDNALAKLEAADKEKIELQNKIDLSSSKIRSQANKIESVESALNEAKKEYTEIERELLGYKVRNVKRRRDWGNAMQFLVDPLGALQRSFHPSKEIGTCKLTSRSSL